MSTLQCNCQ